MPIKYAGISEVPVKMGGAIHGGLFVLYCLLIIPMWKIKNWNFKTALIVGMLSIPPFGTFYMKNKYLQEDQTS